MTNIFAVRVEYEKKPYIFCVADSQSTSLAQHTKHTEQKLVQRGHNLIMDTGRADIAAQVYAQLLGKQGTARELAEHILRLTEDTAKRYENDDRSQTRFFVAGKDKFLLTAAANAPKVPSATSVTIEGILNDRQSPMELKVLAFKPSAP